MKTLIILTLSSFGILFLVNHSAGQNVGIGTDTPDQKLEVAGNIKLGDNIMVEGTDAFRIYRNLVSYNLEDVNSAGAFVIRTNQPWSNSEFSMLIEGYVFDPSCQLFIITVGGFSGAYSHIYQGNYKLNIQVGRETASDKLVVVLGDTAGSYSYPKVAVVQFKQSWANINESNADGWTITRETSLAAFSNLVAPAADVQWLENGTDIYYNTGEVGIGLDNPTCPLHVRTTNNNSNGNAAVIENQGTGTGQYMTALYAQCPSTATTNPGAAIYGNHNSIAGNSAGVTGESMSTTGRGLYGYASSLTGTNYGIYAKTNSTTDGYAGYFEGPMNFFNGKVGIGEETPAFPLEILGSAETTIRVKSHASAGIELVKLASLFPPYYNQPDWKIVNDDYLYFWEGADDFQTNPDHGFLMGQDYFAPYVDGDKDLGDNTRRWYAVYAVEGTIQTSDYNQSQDIQPLQYGLREVLRLNPVAYRLKSGPEDGFHLGLMGQEVESVLPEVVKREVDPETGQENVGMNYAEIIPVLVRAIQEQQARIDELERKLSGE